MSKLPGCWLTICAIWMALGTSAGAEPFTISLQLNGQVLEGMPLSWSPNEVRLLGRDGALWDFSPTEATDFRKTANGFQSLSALEMRGNLAREYGRTFDVSATGQYLVAHPAKRRSAWAPHFDQLYRSFVRYFTARGWRPEPPQFPLVAVVFPRREDFLQQASRDGVAANAGILGYYSPKTNRILLYDLEALPGGGELGSSNVETVMHEAAHQIAFNTGVHSRFAVPPRWVAEGLAMMFETPGVWNARDFNRDQDRIHPQRLAAFKEYSSQRREGSLTDFVSTDRAFSSAPNEAYAEAWALSFFLSETSPQAYIAYLRKTAARPPFSEYSPEERLRDFTAAFGTNLALVEARFLRYLEARTAKVP